MELSSEIARAAACIAPFTRVTPVLLLEPDAFGIPGSLVFKLEQMQHSGSFKARGAFHRMLRATVPAAGVIAASGGNHGAAVAYAARALGHRVEIFVPTIAPTIKVNRLRAYGATVEIVGDRFVHCYAAMQTRARETGALIVHPYDQHEVLDGQGTLAREFEAQVPDLDTLLVAVGGGGLIGGVARWFGRSRPPAARPMRVIGVEPERCPSLHTALAAGSPVDVTVGGIAVDSLGATRIGDLAFEVARDHVAQVVLVTDAQIRQAQLALWSDLRLALEPGGATAFAAVHGGMYRPAPGERVGVILCGANVDPASLE